MTASFRRRSLMTAAGGLLAAPWVRTAHAQQRSITIMAYNGIFEDRYKAAVVEPFMKAHPGIAVNYYSSASSAAMLGLIRAQKAAPQADLCIMDMSVAKAGTDEQILETVTPERLPVMRELYPTALVPGVAGPAVTFDNLVLLYAPDKVKPAPTSWKELWNPAYKGQIGVTAVPDIQGISLTLIANRLAGGGDDYMKSLDKGIAMLGDLAPSVQTWDPKPDPYGAIISGNLAMAIGWNARAQVFSGQSPDRLAVSLPDEGSVFQINTLNLIKNAPQTEAALTYMAYALGQEAQKSFTESMLYAPTNAHAQISAAALAHTAATPERMAKMLNVNWIDIAKIRDGVTEQWRRRIISRG
jgi:putative spermidine/putrescine transport system substrate-binding protein